MRKIIIGVMGTGEEATATDVQNAEAIATAKVILATNNHKQSHHQ